MHEKISHWTSREIQEIFRLVLIIKNKKFLVGGKIAVRRSQHSLLLLSEDLHVLHNMHVFEDPYQPELSALDQLL